MKALLSVTVGGPETLVLQDLPEPLPGPGQVLVEVKAAGVNYPDALQIEDKYQVKYDRPFSPGGEIAGVVAAVGDGVDGLAPGDRVASLCGINAMRERLVLEAADCVPIPAKMPFAEAAAFILTYGSAYYALTERGGAQPGESLFVLGAAGGIGVAAIELGKALGLQVFVGVSSQEKLDFCLSKGADGGLIYPRAPLDRAAQKALSGDIKALSGGTDLVLDAVGGDYAQPSVRALNWGGRFLVVGFPAGVPAVPLNLPLLKQADIRGVFFGAWRAKNPEQAQDHLRDLFAFYEDGKVRPHVSKTFGLEDGGLAIRHLMDRKAMGKVVVVM